MIPGGVITAMMRAASADGAVYSYTIDRSLRFNDGDSAHLSRTPGSAGSRTVWTCSFWMKRTAPGQRGIILSTSGSSYTSIGFETSSATDGDSFRIFDWVGSFNGHKVTTRLFRDPTAWYHIVVAWDTGEAAADRIKIYVNGVRETSFSTNVDPGTGSTSVNNTVAHNIGRLASGSGYFDGYIAELHFIDGTAYEASDFGETDATTGTWKPKSPSVTYGTNGFYLSFADNTSATTLGYDDAGSNDWTLNNFSVTAGAGNDSLTDTPTDNYCVWNVVSGLTGGTLSNGNLDSSGSAIGTIDALANEGYWEITANASSVVGGVKNEAGTEHTISIASGKTYGFRLSDAGALDYINITDAGSWTSITTGLSGSWFPYAEGGANTLNCGQRPYAGTKPTGYNTLSTANLPTPTIQDPTDAWVSALDTEANIASTLATARTGWSDYVDILKNRDSSETWAWRFSHDSSNEYAVSTTATRQSTRALSGSDKWVGYSIRVGSAYGTAAGSQAHTNGVATTVTHNLGTTDCVVFLFPRSNGEVPVYHKDLTSGDLLYLTATDAETADTDITNITANSFDIGSGAATDTYDYLVLTSVDGVARVGEYEGNAAADGAFVNTPSGRPGLFIGKRYSSTGSWYLFDNLREGYNVDNDALLLEDAAVESATDYVDLLAGGAKFRSASGPNASGNHVFIALSTMALNYANAR